MRRFWAYLLLSSSLIIGTAAVFGPTITGLDTDISYGTGKELVFKISEKETIFNGIDPADSGAYVDNDNYVAVNAVADEMRARLDGWGASEYSISKEGYDTIRVTLRSQNNEDTYYQYLQYYLPFSGGSISLSASMDETEEYKKSYLQTWDTMFENQTARIEYLQNGSIPVVVIPVNSPKKDGDLGTLVDYCSSQHVEADSSKSTAEVNCYVTLWANKQETDTFAKATSSGDDQDLNVASRFLGAEHSDNVWFKEASEDSDYTEFQYIPSSAALNGNTPYDASKAGAAYQAALYYVSLFNAESYKNIGAGYDVSFAFSTVATPSVEELITSNMNRYPALNSTLIATIIALLIGAGIIALFYRFGAFAIVSGVGVTIISTLLLLSYFSAQFGVGMLMGLLLVALVSVFGGVYYFAKLKDEIYKGRSLKKAHTEASKKSLWPTIDAGIISVVLGLCFYLLIPGVAGKLGLALVIGGFFATIVSLLLTRVQMWLICNDSDAQSCYDRLLNIDKTKVPDLLKEEKQTYFGAFEKKNFMKPWKGIAIGAAAFLIATIGGLTAFSINSNGNPFNFAGAYDDTTSAYIQYRVSTVGDSPKIRGTDDIENGNNGVLNFIYKDGKMLGSSDVSSIVLETSTIHVTGSETLNDGNYNVYYFVVDFVNPYDADATVWSVKNGLIETTDLTLNEAISKGMEAKGVNASSFSSSVKLVSSTAGSPNFSVLCLGLGVGLLSTLVYMCIRYKISRGLTATLLTSMASFITLGAMSLTRVPLAPVAGIAALATALCGLLLAIFILSKEKEIKRESRERDKTTLEFNASCLLKANSYAAGELIVFALIIAYVAIVYFGFGPAAFAYGNLFWLVGLLLGLTMILTLITPFTLFLAKQFSKIHFEIKWGGKKKDSKKSAEPEEAVFIGIND